MYISDTILHFYSFHNGHHFIRNVPDTMENDEQISRQDWEIFKMKMAFCISYFKRFLKNHFYFTFEIQSRLSFNHL